jgi:hypothetical protein
MVIKVGTFNLNNLFSRFNFKAHVDELPEDQRDVTVTYEFTDEGDCWFRTFRGRLVQPMPEEQRLTLAARIKSMDLDVLAVQEVEDIEALNDFNRFHLGRLYPHVSLIEGNDARFIDVGVLSKLPLGGVTSWQHQVHSGDPSQRVFARDLLQVEVLNQSRSKRLFTLFNNHLTSQFVAFGEDPIAAPCGQGGAPASTMRDDCSHRRRRAASGLALSNSGDMNDTPDSEALQPLAKAPLGLVDALEDPQETRPAKDDTPPPTTKAWTHRFKESGQPASYELFDQFWLSQALQDNLSESWIDRRTKHSGDGSDHDPAWVVLDL